MEPKELGFMEQLISLGDYWLTNDYELRKDIIEKYLQNFQRMILVNDIFGLSKIDLDHLLERAILYPNNEDSLSLNEEALRIPVEVKFYFSADTILCDDEKTI